MLKLKKNIIFIDLSFKNKISSNNINTQWESTIY